jgi:hypothetical protein
MKRGGDPQAQSSSDPKVKWRRPRLLLPDRASDLKATAQLRTWSTRERRDRSEDCSAFLLEKTDLILCTESPKRGLTESADRSIAREGQSSLRSATERSRHVGLTNSAFS